MWLQGRQRSRADGVAKVAGAGLRVCISLTGTGRQSKMWKMSPQFPSCSAGWNFRQQEFPIWSDNQRADQVAGLRQPLEDELRVWPKLGHKQMEFLPQTSAILVRRLWLLIFRLWFFIFVIFYFVAAGKGKRPRCTEIVARLCNYLLMLSFYHHYCCLCGHIKLSLF